MSLASLLVRFCSNTQLVSVFLQLAEYLAASTENTLDDELVRVLRTVLMPSSAAETAPLSNVQ